MGKLVDMPPTCSVSPDILQALPIPPPCSNCGVDRAVFSFSWNRSSYITILPSLRASITVRDDGGWKSPCRNPQVAQETSTYLPSLGVCAVTPRGRNFQSPLPVLQTILRRHLLLLLLLLFLLLGTGTAREARTAPL